LVWVHQTKTTIHRIMREHALLARQSGDLNLATEAKLWGQYFRLVAICDLLSLTIQAAGATRVGSLATYAASLSQSFADAQHALAITTAARDLRGASAAQ
jgi:hypothetical protein